jgi:hypothetical protein
MTRAEGPSPTSQDKYLILLFIISDENGKTFY